VTSFWRLLEVESVDSLEGQNLPFLLIRSSAQPVIYMQKWQ